MQSEQICSRCQDRLAYCKGMCQRCYYATRRGQVPFFERLRARNFLEGEVGVVSDPSGHRWIVDQQDFPTVAGLLWVNNGNGYAATGGKVKKFLHQLLMPDCPNVDHIDRNPYNNRRLNLRDGSSGINQLNSPKRQGTRSRFRGVYATPLGRWQARINVNDARHYLGTFDTEEEAHEAVVTFARTVGREAFYAV